MMDTAFTIIFALLALFFVVWIYVLLPADMARNRHRSAFGWVLLSQLFSPILACLLLVLVGGNPNRPQQHTRGF